MCAWHGVDLGGESSLRAVTTEIVTADFFEDIADRIRSGEIDPQAELLARAHALANGTA